MLSKIASLLGVEKIVPEDLLKKGLQKVDPRFKKFFNESAKYGYPLGATIGFLKSELAQGSQPVNRQLRPDVAANVEIQRQQQLPGRIAGAAANIASGAALGGIGGAALAGLTGVLGQRGQQGQQPSGTIEEARQAQPTSREEALKQHAEMSKRKKLFDQLKEEFEGAYPEQPQQGAPSGNIERLIQLLQKRKQGMR